MTCVTEDLASTLGRVEGSTLEFKREPKDRTALREAICALANDLVGRGGGDLLIGVDRNGNPHPVDTSDEALLLIAQIRDEGRILERPSLTVDRAYLQFVRYAGVDVDAPIRDEDEIRDNLITATRTLTSLLQGNVTREVKEVDALTERTQDDYPLPALREAIFNAVMHRTYEGSHAPVRILWFDDRIEVTNPGGPFGAVNSENFDRVNDYRNPSLAAAMKTLGYVNRFGRGIERMRLQMQRNGNPPPEFEVTPSWWRVTLPRAT